MYYQQPKEKNLSSKVSKRVTEAIETACKDKHRIGQLTESAVFITDALDRCTSNYFNEGPSIAENIQIIKAIQKTFYYLTTDEIELAFELAIIKREINCPYKPKSITITFVMELLKEYASFSYPVKNKKPVEDNNYDTGKHEWVQMKRHTEFYGKLIFTTHCVEVVNYVVEQKEFSKPEGWDEEYHYAIRYKWADEIIHYWIKTLYPDIPEATYTPPPGNVKGLVRGLSQRVQQLRQSIGV